MSKLALCLAASLSLLLHSAAYAQSLAGSAETLRETLRALAGTVEDRVPKESGQRDINSSIDKTRGELATLRDLASSYAPGEQLRDSVAKVHDHLDEVWKRLGGLADRDSLRPLVSAARFQMTRVDVAYANYRPVYAPGRQGGYVAPPTVVVSRDTWARGIAINHLARFFQVPPATIEATTVERQGSRFRVFARSRKIGAYIVNLDAASGRVYSATPVR